MQVIKDESQYNMIDWWKKVLLDNYANFGGRAEELSSAILYYSTFSYN